MGKDLVRGPAEHAERWRSALSEPLPDAPAEFEPSTSPRWRGRWVAPVTAAALVAAVLGGGALLLGGAPGGGPRPDHPTPAPTRPPKAGAVVPWAPIVPRHPDIPAFEQIWVPDPRLNRGRPQCRASDVDLSARLGSTTGSSLLEIAVSAAGAGVSCRLSELPVVTLYDGARPLDVLVERGEPAGHTWLYDVPVDATHSGVFRLSWGSSWCGDPVDNDRIVLAWPGGGDLEVNGLGAPPQCDGSAPETRSVRVHVSGFAPRDWEIRAGAPVLYPIAARQVALGARRPDGRATFMVELLAPARDVSLAYCPDAEVYSRSSPDDEWVFRFGLNCAGVPHSDGRGQPYLPQGVPVRFAVEATRAQLPGVPYAWRLVTPRPITIPLGVAGEQVP